MHSWLQVTNDITVIGAGGIEQEKRVACWSGIDNHEFLSGLPHDP